MVSEISDKTHHGIDTLQVMIRLAPVLKHRNIKAYDKFKSYLAQQLQRGLRPHEEQRLKQAIDDYILSNEGTNRRAQAIKYLMELGCID